MELDQATMAATGKWDLATLAVDGVALLPAVGKVASKVFDVADAVQESRAATSLEESNTELPAIDKPAPSTETGNPAKGPAADTAPTVVDGAVPKIGSLTSRYGPGIEGDVLKNGTRYVDTTNGGNINVFMPRPDGSGFIRVTLDPSGQRIISAGLNTSGNVTNGIANGRFFPIS